MPMKHRKKYQAILFDLDGTLLDTLEDLKNSVNAVMRQYHMSEHSLETIRKFVGNGVERLMERSIPEGKACPWFGQALAAFQEHYAAHCNDRTGLYPGIPALLHSLKQQGFLMAVVSNKYQRGLDLLVEQYFKETFQAAVGEVSSRPKKPAPDGIYEALRQLGVTAEGAVYVGDSDVDIITARNAGMDCIAVGWGFRTREEQEAAGGRVFVRNTAELAQYLLGETERQQRK